MLAADPTSRVRRALWIAYGVATLLVLVLLVAILLGENQPSSELVPLVSPPPQPVPNTGQAPIPSAAPVPLPGTGPNAGPKPAPTQPPVASSCPPGEPPGDVEDDSPPAGNGGSVSLPLPVPTPSTPYLHIYVP
jgi:hypothetical protein